jgi:hypothetical protein
MRKVAINFDESEAKKFVDGMRIERNLKVILNGLRASEQFQKAMARKEIRPGEDEDEEGIWWVGRDLTEPSLVTARVGFRVFPKESRAPFCACFEIGIREKAQVPKDLFAGARIEQVGREGKVYWFRIFRIDESTDISDWFKSQWQQIRRWASGKIR